MSCHPLGSGSKAHPTDSVAGAERGASDAYRSIIKVQVESIAESRLALRNDQARRGRGRRFLWNLLLQYALSTFLET